MLCYYARKFVRVYHIALTSKLFDDDNDDNDDGDDDDDANSHVNL